MVFSREHVAYPCIMGGFGTAVNPVFYMVYLKITKKVKRGLTNRKNDATIGPSPAGVNPISTPVPFSPPKGSQSYPLLVRPAGVFLWGTRFSPMVRKLTISITLKVEKICRVCIAYAGGVGCPLRTRTQSDFFLSYH